MIQKEHLDPKKVAKLLLDDATLATILHIICLGCYGEEIYQVDPIELYARLEDDFGAKLTEANENKLQAILTATATDLFYETPDAFRSICNALSAGDPGIDGLDDLTVPEILWGLYEVELNREPTEMNPAIANLIATEIAEEAQDPDFAEDPTAYVHGFMADRHQDLVQQMAELGVHHAPPPIKPPEPPQTPSKAPAGLR